MYILGSFFSYRFPYNFLKRSLVLSYTLQDETHICHYYGDQQPVATEAIGHKGEPYHYYYVKGT